MLLVGDWGVLRILAVRWIGVAARGGRRLLLGTGSWSVLGYDDDLTEPVIHAWKGRGTDIAGTG